MIEARGDHEAERRSRQTWRSPVRWLLLAAMAAALWCGWPVASAGLGDSLASSGAVWPCERHGAAMTVGVAEYPEGRASSETRNRCELALRLAAPGGATIAVVECTYERSTREERVRDVDAIELNPPVRHRRWVWVALALLPVLLVCVLLPEAE